MAVNSKSSLGDLVDAFDRWRSLARGSRNETPPDELCERVCAAVRRYGAHRVKKAVSLSDMRLEACLGFREHPTDEEDLPSEDEGAAAGDPAFTEIVVQAPMSVSRPLPTPVCMIEAPSGVKLTVYSSDVAASALIGAIVAKLSVQGVRGC